MSTTDVAIVGIGLYPFGRHPGVSAVAMGAAAARTALRDAGVEWSDIQFAYGGSYGAHMVGGEGTTADSMVRWLGLTGLPFVNVSNGCATAGSAVSMAYNTVSSGQGDLGLVVGFDKHPRGSFDVDPTLFGLEQWYGETGMMLTTQFFAMKINRYLHDHGIDPSVLAAVAAKSYRHGAATPTAWRREAFSEEQIAGSPMLNYPLTKYMFCSPSEGAAALIVCRADRAHRYTDTPVYIRGVTVRTRLFGSFEVFSTSLPEQRAPAPTVATAAACFDMAGIGPEEVRVAQLQDSEAGAEIIHLAENGFCANGDQERMVHNGDTAIGGKLPVNTDGGLLCNGEPIGASGLRQIHEICVQLRGQAGARQVPGNPNVGYTQVYGAPGVAACTVLTT
ncbi:thiolase family protein [Nocardia donostiensis]|uniref:Acetyl-CoA acetyltransferase n=1 Tax=Nocardia donostiensis TaxID=1538463 RepID=A0A1W0B879_9NOCA|nr:thiolase family protein [Nocardia donostiensis]ONM50445.1 acetyl-CoA acetyltransferase [Nocardia donostiensis]OQS17319.1 acetyl-CoA acetyltransferase [Nocardia donostiensis]OQS18704.1 acetyl-CoA acetyltransferase [Nocardia donostiensis]